ncbi:response regulator [Peribacillus glennii]|uniref:DNA-binding response regulator n=1 Tax=Peribacillus glennii TaxID=2303991 RepID=A0A372LAR5_9BACI|nr:response regulator transcription factor [Peribacillus glennii]RFU62835.1 DNA-binding response regulator [Peribacillus glennii]
MTKRLELIEDYLSKWGFHPILADDFENVDRQVVTEKPHILLLDINLPVLHAPEIWIL